MVSRQADRALRGMCNAHRARAAIGRRAQVAAVVRKARLVEEIGRRVPAVAVGPVAHLAAAVIARRAAAARIAALVAAVAALRVPAAVIARRVAARIAAPVAAVAVRVVAVVGPAARIVVPVVVVRRVARTVAVRTVVARLCALSSSARPCARAARSSFRRPLRFAS